VLDTNTVVRPAGTEIGSGLGSFYGKPYRLVKALDLGKPRPSPTVMALARVEETEKYEDHTASVKEEDEEEVRRQKVNRPTRRP
jgi:hypothetical protein